MLAFSMPSAQRTRGTIAERQRHPKYRRHDRLAGQTPGGRLRRSAPAGIQARNGRRAAPPTRRQSLTPWTMKLPAAPGADQAVEDCRGADGHVCPGSRFGGAAAAGQLRGEGKSLPSLKPSGRLPPVTPEVTVITIMHAGSIGCEVSGCGRLIRLRPRAILCDAPTPARAPPGGSAGTIGGAPAGRPAALPACGRGWIWTVCPVPAAGGLDAYPGEGSVTVVIALDWYHEPRVLSPVRLSGSGKPPRSWEQGHHGDRHRPCRAPGC